MALPGGQHPGAVGREGACRLPLALGASFCGWHCSHLLHEAGPGPGDRLGHLPEWSSAQRPLPGWPPVSKQLDSVSWLAQADLNGTGRRFVVRVKGVLGPCLARASVLPGERLRRFLSSLPGGSHETPRANHTQMPPKPLCMFTEGPQSPSALGVAEKVSAEVTPSRSQPSPW